MLPPHELHRRGETVINSRTIVSLVGSFLFGPQFRKKERKPFFPLRKRQVVYLDCLLVCQIQEPLKGTSDRGVFIGRRQALRYRAREEASASRPPPRPESSPAARRLPSAGAKPRPAPPEPVRGRRARGPLPRVPQAGSTGWVEGAVETRAQARKSCPRRPARTAGTCLSVGVAGGRRGAAMSSRQRGSPTPGAQERKWAVGRGGVGVLGDACACAPEEPGGLSVGTEARGSFAVS